MKKWLARLSNRWKVNLDEEYKKAHDFKDRYTPQEDVDYEWVSHYAREIYNRLDQAD